MPAVNGVGKPCAGKPHARFDGRGLETERPGHGHWGGTTDRETGGHEGPRPYRQAPPPRQPSTLQRMTFGVSVPAARVPRYAHRLPPGQARRARSSIGTADAILALGVDSAEAPGSKRGV
jgi:hypothetical protein